jgi:hypothetical protein
MGYTTEFNGRFKVNKTLDRSTQTFLKKFAETRRMKRNLGPEFGIEGEFFVDAKGSFGQDKSLDVTDYNNPPRTQPGLWCQWIPSEDGKFIQWDGNEKFYEYVAWLEYLIKNFLAPKGYVLNGTVEWQGEDSEDVGRIGVKKNVVKTQQAKLVYEDWE